MYHDCSSELRKYHNECVTLGTKQRTEMKEKRDTNRDRLNRGLDENTDPRPEKRVSQGSYIMRTMVQHDQNAYDVDDGALFIDTDLKNKDGSKMSARQAKEMVLNALMCDTKQFKTDP